MEEKEVARSLKYVILFSEWLAFGGRSANIYRGKKVSFEALNGGV